MVSIGYFLSTEEFEPGELLQQAPMADANWITAAPTGRRPVHLGITAAGLAAVGSAVAGRYRLAGLFAAAWAAGTAEFATHRISAGPGIPAEVAAMVATSAMIPPFASAHWFRGVVRAALISPSKDG